MFGMLINGNLKELKMPIRNDGKDIFTNDEQIIRQNGYKEVVYTEMPIDAETYHWKETDTQIIQVWGQL